MSDINNFFKNKFSFVFFVTQGNTEALTLAKHSQIRQTLLTQVSLEVESRSNSSLHNRVYIVLDAEQNPEQIELPCKSEIKLDCRRKIRLDNTDIINIFDRSDVAGRLLILGQSGAGKTTVLLKLASELINRAKNDASYPLLVLFSLSSWKNDQQSIKEWLIAQLQEKYGLRKHIGKLWIAHQKIILLLDGLDELAAERQEKCVIKINDFLHASHWSNSIVVCCRSQEYQYYNTFLQLNNSLELDSLNIQKVNQYLLSTDNLKLWDSISHDAELSQLAKTPLLLNIIVLCAEEISIQTWQQFQSYEERLNYLFDAYISRMFKRPYYGKNKQPKQENTRRWLSWLAHQLIEESTTEFLIEKMHPDLLKNQFQKNIYNFLVWGIIGVMINGLINLVMNRHSSWGLRSQFDFQIYGLIVGLIYGLIYGLISDLIENKIKKRILLINFQQKFVQKTIYRLIYLLIFGLIYVLIFGLFYALSFGMYFALVWVVILATLFRVNYGQIYWLIYGLIEHMMDWFLFEALHWLAYGLIGGLVYLLISGIDRIGIEDDTFDYQGIKQSVINTIKSTAIPSFFTFLILCIINLIVKPGNIAQQVLINNLEWGLLWGMIIGIPRGVTPAIKHFVLRVILWCNGYLPWNYAKFLNYCANRLFLQRVGGGYCFIHDLLRHHFDQSYTQIKLSDIQEISVTISPLVQNYVVCTHCNHNNSANLNFCTKCGTPLIKPHIPHFSL